MRAPLLAALLFSACGSDDGPQSIPCAMPSDGFCICGDVPPTRKVAECSKATMGGDVVCCQGKTDCICGTFDCSQSSADSCFCTSIGVGDKIASCTGTVCCADPGGTCNCGTTACSGSEKQVPSCSAANALCSAGTVRVEKCGG